MDQQSDVTRDELKRFGWTCCSQNKGTASALILCCLCDFANARQETSIVDLGTGSGVLALVLAQMALSANVTAFEQDAELHSYWPNKMLV
jgi:tRNA1Val (adenine37-N6)-methyltransferase